MVSGMCQRIVKITSIGGMRIRIFIIFIYTYRNENRQYKKVRNMKKYIA